MRHVTAIGLTACVLPVLLAAQDTRPDFARELKTLQEAYKKAEQDWMAPLRNAKSDADRKLVKLDFEKHPSKEYLGKFQDLAERAKGTEAELDASIFILQNQRTGAGRKELALRLVRAFPDSSRLEQVVSNLNYAAQEPDIKAALAAVVEQSPHKAVRAAALMASAGNDVSNGNFTAAQRPFLDRLVSEFADTRYGKDAKGALRVNESYANGRTPPDFTGTGVHDETIKLSDYRGKVVLIDFWGYW